jgi:hypothetical protein
MSFEQSASVVSDYIGMPSSISTRFGNMYRYYANQWSILFDNNFRNSIHRTTKWVPNEIRKAYRIVRVIKEHFRVTFD